MNDKRLVEKDDKNAQEGADGEPPAPKLVPFKRLYTYITAREKCWLIIGTIAALGMGVALPGFALLFGGVIN